jgi:hypothetical protein
MKIWKSFGSAHSAHLTVVGTFSTVGDAETAKQLIESFLGVSWGEEHTVQEFFEMWEGKEPGVRYYGPREAEFQLGIDNDPDVTRTGTTVAVRQIRSVEIGGFVKLMMLKSATEVKVTGEVGP